MSSTGISLQKRRSDARMGERVFMSQSLQLCFSPMVSVTTSPPFLKSKSILLRFCFSEAPRRDEGAV